MTPRYLAAKPARPSRPAPEPLDVDAVGTVIVGTLVWFVLFLVLLPLRHRLGHDGHEAWLWTSLAGWVLGLIGLPLAWRARAAARRARLAVGSAAPAGGPGAEPATAGPDVPTSRADLGATAVGGSTEVTGAAAAPSGTAGLSGPDERSVGDPPAAT